MTFGRLGLFLNCKNCVIRCHKNVVTGSLEELLKS